MSTEHAGAVSGAPVADEGERKMRDRDTAPLVRQVVEALEEDIVFGYLHPRERLVEDDLRARFNLKRHVVRQVLAELEQMGLVERKKNIGALVKSYTVKEVSDLYTAREILETSCAGRIPFPVADSKLDELISIQQRHDKAAAEGDLRSAFRTNIAFHKALFALSDNGALTELIEVASLRAHSIRSLTMVYPHDLEQSRQDHWRMIEALRQADHERLVQLCKDHLLPSRDAYIRQQRLLRQAAPSAGILSVVPGAADASGT